MCAFIVWIWDFIKKFCKTMVYFLKKKLRYLKSKISTKFHCLLFYFIFSAFLHFFFQFQLSKLVQKLWNFLQWFIGRVRDFTNDFWKILKVFLKKALICEIFFFQNFALHYFFFYFLLFLTSYFQFRLSVLVKKF